MSAFLFLEVGNRETGCCRHVKAWQSLSLLDRKKDLYEENSCMEMDILSCWATCCRAWDYDDD